MEQPEEYLDPDACFTEGTLGRAPEPRQLAGAGLLTPEDPQWLLGVRFLTLRQLPGAGLLTCDSSRIAGSGLLQLPDAALPPIPSLPRKFPSQTVNFFWISAPNLLLTPS